MKSNIIIILVVLLIGGVFLYASSSSSQSQPGMINKTSEDGFVYKSDPRSFEHNPNNAAIEEGWTEKDDIMVLVKPNSQSVTPFYIDAFEATISNHRAWSVAGQQPTDKLRYDDAHTACIAAGKRLCYVHEWQTACRGGYTQPVRFPNAEQLMKDCDFARSNTYDRYDYVEKTDSHPYCTPSNMPLFHMVGNVSEFVQSANGRVMIVGLTYYDGKMNNKQQVMSMACERVVAGPGQYPTSRYNKGLGFRCCKNAR